MTPGVRPLVAGNWKMHGFTSSLGELDEMREGVEKGVIGTAELAVCPPATLIALAAARLTGGAVALGAQDCHAFHSGAYTGEISAAMLKDVGCDYVIVGHSERRAAYGESNALVRAKAEAAIRHGLTAIVCVGESLAQRESGRAIETVDDQIKASLPSVSDARAFVIAYEPVWAIGTGLTPKPDEVAEMHFAIRGRLHEQYGESGASTRIIYGGSVKPANAEQLLGLPNVDGALVGGASLRAHDFLAIAGFYAR